MFCLERLQGALARDHVLEPEMRQQWSVLVEIVFRFADKIDMEFLNIDAQFAFFVYVDPLKTEKISEVKRSKFWKCFKVSRLQLNIVNCSQKLSNPRKPQY